MRSEWPAQLQLIHDSGWHGQAYSFARDVAIADTGKSTCPCHPRRRISKRLHADIAEGDDAFVALKHQGAGGFFAAIELGTCWFGNFQILLNLFPIECDADEARVGGFLSRRVKFWRAKNDIQRLPFSRRLAGVG